MFLLDHNAFVGQLEYGCMVVLSALVLVDHPYTFSNCQYAVITKSLFFMSMEWPLNRVE